VLTPHDDAITHSQGVKSPNVNEMSSAMVVTWEGCRVLLGADLINVRGWNALDADPAGQSFSDVPGVKIAHHGSMEAQHTLAVGLPPPGSRTFIVTPFNKQKLPRFDDGGGVDHLLQRTDRLLLTSHWGAVPDEAAFADSARRDLVTPEPAIAGIMFVPDGQRRPDPYDCWVEARWSADGALKSVRRGTGSVSVVA
jgi:hypothetical protein